MNVKKILTGIMACCVAGGVLPSVDMIADNAVIIASAEDKTEKCTEGTYGELYYNKYDDHIEIAGCDYEATDVIIPAEIDGLPVTIINGFFESNITSITIPDSVTNINSKFSYCGRLASINVSENNKYYSNINGVLFNKDKTELVRYPIGKDTKEYIIPDSVTSVGEGAFWCSRLTSIKLPDGVTNIEKEAFACCYDLTLINIPNGTKSIGYRAFMDCKSLMSINISNSVTNIGDCAFIGTSWLEEKRKENSLVIVNGILIDGRTCLGDVTIPNGVKTIGGLAFWLCSDLTSVTIPDSVTGIGDSAFGNCENLTSITIPNSVTSIGEDAFEGAYSLSITILNPECEIDGYYTIEYMATIYGYDNSTSQKYAEKHNCNFVSLGKAPQTEIDGDADCNGAVNVADAIVLQKWLLGSGNLTNWENVDLCKDGRIDVFDMIEMRKLIINSQSAQ